MKRKQKEQQEKENIIPISQHFPPGRSRSKSTKIQYSTHLIQNNQNYLYNQQYQQFNDQLQQLKQQQEQTYFQNEENLKQFVRYPKSSRGVQELCIQKENTLGGAVRSDIQDLKQLKSFLLENDLEQNNPDKGRDNKSEQSITTASNTITLPSTGAVINGLGFKNQSEISCYLDKMVPFKDSTNINTIQKSTILQNSSYLPKCINILSKSTNTNDKTEKNNQVKPQISQGEYLAVLENYQTINHDINVMNVSSSMNCNCDLPNKTQSALSDKTTIPTFREIMFCQNHCQYQKGVNQKNKQQNNQSTQYSNSSQCQRRPLIQRNAYNNQYNIKQKNNQNEIECQSNSIKANLIPQKRSSYSKKRENSQTQQNEQNLLEVSLFSFLQNPPNTQNITQTNQFGRLQSRSVFSVSKDGHNNKPSNQNQQNIPPKYVAQQSEERKHFNQNIHNVLLNFKAMQQQQQNTLNFSNNGNIQQQTTQPIVQRQQIHQNSIEMNRSCFNDHLQQQQSVINSYQSFNNNLNYQTNFTNDKQKVSLPSIHNNNINRKQGRSLSFNGGNNNSNNMKLNQNKNNINQPFDCFQDSQMYNTSLYKIFN